MMNKDEKQREASNPEDETNPEKNCVTEEKQKDEKQKPKVTVYELEEKIKSLEAELKREKSSAEEHKTKGAQYLSTASYYKNMAEETKRDFERFKERNKNIETEAKVKANEQVIKKLLPIIDNFDQAINSVSPEIMRGFVMIYSALGSVLSELGAVEIKTKNEKLNPEKHNCIDTVQTDDESLDGSIAKVYQKGYEFSETGAVIRPSNVSVYKLNSKP